MFHQALGDDGAFAASGLLFDPFFDFTNELLRKKRLLLCSTREHGKPPKSNHAS
jgi:hypothetical protein